MGSGEFAPVSTASGTTWKVMSADCLILSITAKMPVKSRRLNVV